MSTSSIECPTCAMRHAYFPPVQDLQNVCPYCGNDAARGRRYPTAEDAAVSTALFQHVTDLCWPGCKLTVEQVDDLFVRVAAAPASAQPTWPVAELAQLSKWWATRPSHGQPDVNLVHTNLIGLFESEPLLAPTDLFEDKPLDFAGRLFCFTGNMTFCDRDYAKRLVIAAGAKVQRKSSEATDFLVIGSEGSSQWKFETYGTKIDSAVRQRLRLKSKVVFIREERFAEHVPLLAERTATGSSGA